jgi:hypothetical protein
MHFGPVQVYFRTGTVFAMIALYVNGISAACNDATCLSSFKGRLDARFRIKDLGDLSQLLGMHITRDKPASTISLNHSKYMREIMTKASHDILQTVVPAFGPGPPIRPRTHGLPFPHMSVKGSPPQPFCQPPIRRFLHASKCFYGFEHSRLRPCASHGVSSPVHEESGSLPSRHSRPTPNVGGGEGGG